MKTAVLIACLAVLAVLGLGLYSMWKGGDFARKYSNKLMRLRVALQALAIAIIMIGLFFAQRH